MRSYTVHHRHSLRYDILAAPEETEFVKEGFCWPALFVPFLWLIYRRLWLVFLAYLALTLFISALAKAQGVPEPWASFAGYAINLLLAFFANDLRRARLAARGLRFVGVSFGRSLDEAEHRFFTRLAAGEEPFKDLVPAPYSEESGPPEPRRRRLFGLLPPAREAT